ncbi:hypothetical protein BDZ45DRAFT_754276 [Acephala macrosclerotiorum]|nr:hypothetical protein BDZ45DRAFT_754276 [Acephala macrosclerotiorum]
MTGHSLTNAGRPYDFGADYHLPEEQTHVVTLTTINIGQDLYERYPVFEDRPRILVLWLGGINLIIALLSLAVSILQAVVAVQTFNATPSNPTGNTTSSHGVSPTGVVQDTCYYLGGELAKGQFICDKFATSSLCCSSG